MSDEISYDTRLALRQLQASVRSALEDGIDPELVLDAVAAGLEASTLDGRAFGSSPLALSLTRAFNSSVGPAMGGSGPTEVLDTSAGPVDALPPASQGPHAPGPAEAPDENWILTPGDGTASVHATAPLRCSSAVTAFERTVL